MAEGLTDASIVSYQRILKKLSENMEERTVGSITTQDIVAYLNWLRTDYISEPFTGKTKPLSPMTIHNAWIGLASFFAWAHQELKLDIPTKEVPPPKFQTPPVEAYTQDEVKALLKACLYARQSPPQDRHKFAARRPSANWDQAIILFLVDTRVRASEFAI